jgi:hypothetical protein
MIITDADRGAFSHHVFVDARHRFIFFTIPKVACTQWIQLFRRLKGATNWRDDPHFQPDRPYLSLLPVEQCERILNGSGWLKAAFFRDPVERLVSAYLDKFVYRKSYIIAQTGFGDRTPSFEEFLSFVLDPNQDAAQPRGLHLETNPHWRPQSLVGNIGQFADRLDFVGHFDRLHEDTSRILRRLDLWDDYGATGWGPNGTNAMFEVNDAVNKTDARVQIERYLTSQQFKRVRQAYHQDYDMFERLGLGNINKRCR